MLTLLLLLPMTLCTKGFIWQLFYLAFVAKCSYYLEQGAHLTHPLLHQYPRCLPVGFNPCISPALGFLLVFEVHVSCSDFAQNSEKDKGVSVSPLNFPFHLLFFLN